MILKAGDLVSIDPGLAISGEAWPQRIVEIKEKFGQPYAVLERGHDIWCCYLSLVPERTDAGAS